MNKTDYKILVDCITISKRDDGTEYKHKKDGTPKHLVEIVQEVMFNNTNYDFDLDYDIIDDALMFLSDIELKDIKESRDSIDERLYEQEFASVYTGMRLSYLNNHNESEIRDKQKEYSTDINNACAMWYDEQVQNAVNELLNYIIE